MERWSFPGFWKAHGLSVAIDCCLRGDWGPVFRARCGGEQTNPKHMALDYNDV